MRELQIQIDSTYFSQARDRSEAAVNQFLGQQYIIEFNNSFSVNRRNLRLPLDHSKMQDLNLVFSREHERVWAAITRCALPISVADRTHLRGTLLVVQ